MPLDRLFKAVVSPKEFRTADKRRGTKDSPSGCLFCLLTESFFILQRLGTFEHLCTRLPKCVENCHESFRLGNVTVFSEICLVYCSHEIRTPVFILGKARHPRSMQAITRELGRFLERQPIPCAKALHVAPHVVAFDWIDVKW